jgi:hypothetical protein
MQRSHNEHATRLLPDRLLQAHMTANNAFPIQIPYWGDWHHYTDGIINGTVKWRSKT